MRVFRISDYLITPQDILRGIRFLYARATLYDFLGIMLLSLTGITLIHATTLSGEAIFIILFVASMLFWRVDSRLPLTLGILCLATIPALLFMFHKNILLTGEYRAEQLAIWAYYFLVIGVLLQLLPFTNKKKSKITNTPLIAPLALPHQKSIPSITDIRLVKKRQNNHTKRSA